VTPPGQAAGVIPDPDAGGPEYRPCGVSRGTLAAVSEASAPESRPTRPASPNGPAPTAKHTDQVAADVLMPRRRHTGPFRRRVVLFRGGPPCSGSGGWARASPKGNTAPARLASMIVRRFSTSPPEALHGVTTPASSARRIRSRHFKVVAPAWTRGQANWRSHAAAGRRRAAHACRQKPSRSKPIGVIIMSRKAAMTPSEPC